MGSDDEWDRLDADLAAGRVDATTYRRRRDALLARRRDEDAARAARLARSSGATDSTDTTAPSGTREEPVPEAPEAAAPSSAPEAPAPEVPAPEVPAPEVPPSEAPAPEEPDAGSSPPRRSDAHAVGPGPAGRPGTRWLGDDPTPAPGARPVTATGADTAADAAQDAGARHPVAPVPGAPADTEPPGRGPDTDVIPVVRDVPARTADPFPPPFRWSAAPQAGPAPRVGDDEPGRTQVVPGPPARPAPSTAGFRPPSFVPPPEPERTQVVPGAHAGRMPSAPVPISRTLPPWAGPPPGGPGIERARRGMQGSEVFLRRRRDLAQVLTTVAVSAVVLLVLVLSFTLG